MSIHAAGPRLFKTIPFRHIAKNRKTGASGGGAVNVALNVTPFVDMMTILVTFLLMVFASEGALVLSQKRLQMAEAIEGEQLRNAPIIVISKDEVAFNPGAGTEGNPSVGRIEDIMNDLSSEARIPELGDKLKRERERFFQKNLRTLPENEQARCTEDRLAKPVKGEECIGTILVLQADKGTPAKVINRVIFTARLEQYVNMMFAINRKTSRK